MAANANELPRKSELRKKQLSPKFNTKPKTSHKLAHSVSEPNPISGTIHPKLNQKSKMKTAHDPNITKSTEKKISRNDLKIGSWNIKRGLITKENELKALLREEKFDILFLNETDTKNIKSKKDFEIDGFVTILPKIPSETGLVRMISLVSKFKIKVTIVT